MKKKTIFGILCAFIVLLQLTACGGGQGSGTEQKGNEAQGVPAPKKDAVELVFFQPSSGWDEQKFMDSYGNKIKEKFPHLTLKFIPSGKLADLMTSGQTIDLFFSSIGYAPTTLMQYDLQYDISDLIKKYQVDLNRFEPTSLAIQKQLANGGLYGLPVSTSSAALFYNKDIFDRFGYPYPKDGMTWDETLEIAKKLTRVDAGQQFKGLSMSFGHISTVNQLSLSYFDPKTNKALFESDKFKLFFDTMRRFYEIPGNEITKDYDSTTEQEAMFKKNRLSAMMAHLNGNAISMPADMNWDMVSLPTYKEAPGIGPQSYPSYFFVTNTSKYKEQSFEVMQYLASDEFQTWQSKRGQISPLNNKEVSKVFGQEVENLKGKNIKAMLPDKYAEPMIRTSQTGDAENLLVKKFMEANQNNIDTNTILRQASEELNKLLESAASK